MPIQVLAIPVGTTPKTVASKLLAMHSTASIKPPDGKLVNLAVTHDETIEDVTITGDFFLEPPSARRELEKALTGHPVDVDKETLITAIEAVDATLIGFDADDLATATMEALQ